MEPTNTQLLAAITQMQETRVQAADIENAVAHGLQRAMADPEVWAAAIAAMRTRAEQEAGSWLFGGLKMVASRIGWVLVIGLAIYLIGGWSALVSFLKGAASQP